jgi:thioredoxin-like negative regulator of GroEL
MDEELRNQVFANLSLKETDELIEIWQDNNRWDWSDMAFEVIQQILLTRVGQLPAQDPPNNEMGDQEASDALDEKITNIINFAESGDINALVEMMDHDPDQWICLDAAMALAQLGDERGLDFLIGALRHPDIQIASDARKLLIDLSHPRGNLALQAD